MIGTNAKLAEAMATTAKTMKNINQVVKPEQVAATANSFREASMKMEMTDEMSMLQITDCIAFPISYSYCLKSITVFYQKEIYWINYELTIFLKINSRCASTMIYFAQVFSTDETYI